MAPIYKMADHNSHMLFFVPENFAYQLQSSNFSRESKHFEFRAQLVSNNFVIWKLLFIYGDQRGIFGNESILFTEIFPLNL